ncbi:hypothetical protein ASPTUDRAFT_560992 [Aspergillus tubingensis CBS 134.48]|uniref:Uncharacterized protein n=1 Tax=Aspergillus tubingensis (strain CBS 134.48) TaxID=767770 RepID=A0A1L9N7M9_ASPTC|nr:hypothetical protein ASPTUDRAFT_560992 [Aspergillus tubingensis CBS 134.48]
MESCRSRPIWASDFQQRTNPTETRARDTTIFPFWSNGGGCLGSMAGGRCARRSSRSCLSKWSILIDVILLISLGHQSTIGAVLFLSTSPPHCTTEVLANPPESFGCSSTIDSRNPRCLHNPEIEHSNPEWGLLVETSQ